MESSDQRTFDRPINSYFIFNSENRRRICDENPGLGKCDVSRLLGKLWKELDPIKKQEFCQRAKDIRKQRSSRWKGKDSEINWLATRTRRETKTTRRYYDFKSGLFRYVTIPVVPIAPILSHIDVYPKPTPVDWKSVDSPIEPIEAAKVSFMRYLGLCSINSVERRNILERQRLSELRFPLIGFRRVIVYHKVKPKPPKLKTEVTEVKINKMKRPRGRPRKHWPKVELSRTMSSTANCVQQTAD